jgi:alpha-L-fucosidase
MLNNYPPGTTYHDLAKDLTCEAWNADEWVELFHNAGAKYVVLTSKHHEGFTMWPSQYSDPPNWNSGDDGPHRDIVGKIKP